MQYSKNTYKDYFFFSNSYFDFIKSLPDYTFLKVSFGVIMLNLFVQTLLVATLIIIIKFYYSWKLI